MIPGDLEKQYHVQGNQENPVHGLEIGFGQCK